MLLKKVDGLGIDYIGNVKGTRNGSTRDHLRKYD